MPRADDVRPPQARRRESVMMAERATPRDLIAHPSEPCSGRTGAPPRPESAALAWARLVLRPDVVADATLGQVLLARRLAGA
jgi:hypothetical protein